jgi:hypothetical protein
LKRISIALVLVAGCGATHVKVEPVKVQPIHITVDVNLKDGAGSSTPSATGEVKPQ